MCSLGGAGSGLHLPTGAGFGVRSANNLTAPVMETMPSDGAPSLEGQSHAF